MRLWILGRAEDDSNPVYDAVHGFVLRAEDEQKARLLANDHHGDEGHRWTDPSFATCVELLPDGPAGVMLIDFNAG